MFSACVSIVGMLLLAILTYFSFQK